MDKQTNGLEHKKAQYDKTYCASSFLIHFCDIRSPKAFFCRKMLQYYRYCP